MDQEVELARLEVDVEHSFEDLDSDDASITQDGDDDDAAHPYSLPPRKNPYDVSPAPQFPMSAGSGNGGIDSRRPGQVDMAGWSGKLPNKGPRGTQFTCFPSSKVQILT